MAVRGSGKAPPHPCEFDRALEDVLGPAHGPKPEARSNCSPEAPEERDYPLPPAPRQKYFLCNGHLRDLFEAMSRVEPLDTPTPPA
jgi:hypothetical protein